MIVLNGKKFARNESEFVNSLFEIGGTCVGYYKRTKSGVNLYDHKRNIVGCVTKNKVLANATKLDNGKTWYSHADIGIIGRYDSLTKQREDIDNVLSRTDEAD